MIAVLLTSRWLLIVALIGSWSVSAHAQQAEKSDDDTLVLARVAGENEAHPSVTTSDKDKKLQAIVDRIVSRTNAFRKKNELSAVQTEKRLTATAVAFARYMARTGRYGHLADGSRAGERAAEQGYEYCLIAENIAYYFNPDQHEASGYADWFVDGWIESKGHRENMLNEHVTQTGVGVARHDDSGYYFAVQLFGRPQSEHLEFQVVNSAGRSVAYRVLSEGDSRTFYLPARATMTHTRCFAPQIQLDADGAEPTPVEKGARYLIENNGDRLRLTERDQ